MIVTQRTIQAVENAYQQSIETGIVSQIGDLFNLDAQQAMDVYYRSKLASQIAEGSFGIHFLSPRCLVDDLLANETELFEAVLPVNQEVGHNSE